MTDDKELMANIEDILSCYQVDFNDNVIFTKDLFYQCHLDLVNLFKTHRNTVSTAVNQKDDKYSSRDETKSRIAFKNSLRYNIGRLITADQELDQIVENIVNFFVDTVNPVFRALNDSDEQSIIK